MDKDDGFPSAMNVTLKSWPCAKTQPHPTINRGNGRWPEWLTEPPASMIDRETALPVAMYSRLFREAFWARGGPYYKYGHQALRMPTDKWEGRNLKTHFEFYYIRKKDVPRVFRNRGVYMWILSVNAILGDARHHAISEYMLNLTESLVEASRMGRRLHYDKKIWPQKDGEIMGHIQQIRQLGVQIPNLLGDYRQAQGCWTDLDGNQMSVDAALMAYIDQGRQIITEATEVQRLISIEVQQMQFLVVGVLKQPDETRRDLARYLDIIRYRLQTVLDRMADEALQAALSARQQYLNEIVPDLSREVNDNVNHTDRNARIRAFEAMSAAIQESLPSTRYQLADLADAINICMTQDANGNLAVPPLASFNYLVDGAGLRELRTRWRNLRSLALRDLRSLPRNGPAHRIVTAWLRALRTQRQLAGLATQAERDALSGNLVSSLMTLEL